MRQDLPVLASLKIMITNLLASRKWTFVLATLAIAGTLVAMGKLPKDDFIRLLEWLGAPLLVATGIEKVGSSGDGTVAPAPKDGGAS